jgi:hypothetical protein
MNEFICRLGFLPLRGQFDRELAEELEYHRVLKVAPLLLSGNGTSSRLPDISPSPLTVVQLNPLQPIRNIFRSRFSGRLTSNSIFGAAASMGALLIVTLQYPRNAFLRVPSSGFAPSPTEGTVCAVGMTAP